MKLSNLWFSIDRLSMPEAHICRIDYALDICFTPVQIRNKSTIEVWCELWGHDVFLDTQLEARRYDVHQITATEDCRVKRYFPVDCKILHDDIIGKSEVFIKVIVSSNSGNCWELKGPLIQDNF